MKKKKKGSFLLFVRLFAVFLALALICGWISLIYVKKLKETEREKRLRARIDYVIEHTRYEYNQRKETGMQSIEGIDSALREAIREEDIYVSVTIDNECVGQTFSMSPIGLYYNGDIYDLEGLSYLNGADEFANGMYSIRKPAELERKYRYDPIGLRLFLPSINIEKYSYIVEGAAINSVTKRFIPTRIAMISEAEPILVTGDYEVAQLQNVWARYNTSFARPSDLTNWEYCDESFVPLRNAKCIFTYEDYREPALCTLSDADREHYAYIDEKTGKIVEDEADFDVDTKREAVWSVKFTSKLAPMPMLKMFPIFFWAVIATAFIGAMIPSLVITMILFRRKKVRVAMADFRKRTTEDMAHDLKTPMAAISGYAELLEENWTSEQEEKLPDSASGSDAEKQAEKQAENLKYVQKIRENVSELNRIVEGILFFSKMHGRSGNPVSEPTNLRRLVEESVRKSEYQFSRRGLTVEISGGAPYWNTDPEILSLVFNNLVSNCVRYADPDSEVKIQLSNKEISFRNNYSGTIENVDDLKRPFVKGDESRGEEGTGLGLSIVDNNLKILGLRLKLECKNKRFTATIIKK